MEYSLSSSERPFIASLFQGTTSFSGSKEIHWERKFSKKQRWRRFLSPRASKTTEWQHGDSWDTVCRSPNTSTGEKKVLFRKRVIIATYTLPELIFFDVKLVFISCMSREETPSVEFFGCPRIERGAPDLRVIQAGWPGSRSRWPADRSVRSRNNVKFSFNGRYLEERTGVFWCFF